MREQLKKSNCRGGIRKRAGQNSKDEIVCCKKKTRSLAAREIEKKISPSPMKKPLLNSRQSAASLGEEREGSHFPNLKGEA